MMAYDGVIQVNAKEMACTQEGDKHSEDGELNVSPCDVEGLDLPPLAQDYCKYVIYWCFLAANGKIPS